MTAALRAFLCCSLALLTPGLRRHSRANDSAIKSNDHIVCPVLAALHRAGALKTDSNGDVEMANLFDALHNGLGIKKSLADFQSYGIVVYDESQKGKENSRNACKPPGACYMKRSVLGVVDEDTMRWFNIFDMNGKQALEHGISTGIRGGDTNMPPNAVQCNGKYPCAKRFDQFFGGVVSNGRFYLEDIMKIVCKARQFGDRGGEHAYAESNSVLGFNVGPVPGREWQMRGAMSATLFAFGRTDSQGNLYLTMDDWRALMLEGRYPDGWQRREHGCLLLGCDMSAVKRFNLDVPCDVGYDEPFWQNTGCNVYTGRTCGLFKGCNSGETCVGRKCLCSRGNNLRTMCAIGGICTEQRDDRYSWFGGKRKVFKADNPTPRGNP